MPSIPKKTPVGNTIVEGLAKINDQFCFFLFAEYQLLQRLNDFSTNAGELFTTDVLATNPYAPRIHVRLRDLRRFQEEGRTLSFASFFSASYEIATNFYKSAYDLLQTVIPNQFQLVSNDSPEQQYADTMRVSHCLVPSGDLVETLTYMRYRRNHFIHQRATMRQTFIDLITQRGSALNSHWSTVCRNLDFSSLNVETFGERETTDLLELLRICVLSLDSGLAQSLPAGDLLMQISREVAERSGSTNYRRINRLVAESLAPKVIDTAMRAFGMSCTPLEAEGAIMSLSRL